MGTERTLIINKLEFGLEMILREPEFSYRTNELAWDRSGCVKAIYNGSAARIVIRCDFNERTDPQVSTILFERLNGGRSPFSYGEQLKMRDAVAIWIKSKAGKAAIRRARLMEIEQGVRRMTEQRDRARAELKLLESQLKRLAALRRKP